jgi:general secretion pathway protein G
MLVPRTTRPTRVSPSTSRRLRRSNRVAFTLLEVLLVLAILVVLASLAVGVFGGAQTKANIDATKADIKTISAAADIYKLHTNQWPQQLDDLKVNNANVNGWAGPYIKKENFNDPWGQPYTIIANSDADPVFIVSSPGKPGDNQEISNSAN